MVNDNPKDIIKVILSLLILNMSQLRKKNSFFQYLEETKGGLKKHVEIRNYGFLFLGSIMCQESENLQISLSDYQISSEKYMTDTNGNVMMYVNIWEVKNPGIT